MNFLARNLVLNVKSVNFAAKQYGDGMAAASDSLLYFGVKRLPL